MLLCPRCMSNDIVLKDYLGIKVIWCKNCGYDEREEYDVMPESRRQKCRAVYKAGGSLRTKK